MTSKSRKITSSCQSSFAQKLEMMSTLLCNFGGRRMSGFDIKVDFHGLAFLATHFNGRKKNRSKTKSSELQREVERGSTFTLTSDSYEFSLFYLRT